MDEEVVPGFGGEVGEGATSAPVLAGCVGQGEGGRVPWCVDGMSGGG